MKLFNRHQHEWVVASVKHYEYVLLGGEVTVVLLRCKICKDVTTRKINGVWTKEELFGAR